MPANKDDSNGNDCVEINENKKDDDICELEHLRKLFIGGLAPYTTEDGLRSFYSQWGRVVDVVVMKDQNTKRSRGFGFITYTKSFMVDKAQENRPHIIDGKSVEAKRALPRPEREAQENKSASVKKLFVGGLKDNHDEACLQEYFTQFGNVISVKILTDKTTGKRRGFAFIEYDDYDAVDKAILKKTHSIKYVVVDVKKSIYSKELQKKNAIQHINNMTNQDNKMASKGNARNNMQQQPPQQQMQPFGEAPPPNYSQWGPPAPPMAPQNYGGYPQPPMPPPPSQQQHMANWSYPPTPNTWNAPSQPPGPPQPSPPVWNNNQWGCPPPAGPPGPMPPPNQMPPPGTQPPPNWQQPPIAPPGVAPPGVAPPVVAPPGVAPPGVAPPGAAPPGVAPPGVAPPANGPPPPHHQQAPVQSPPNFGAGYQQNYGGGPTKHQNNMSSNRMNPYGSASNINNSYNNPQMPSGPGYGGYNNSTSNGKPSVNNGTGPASKPTGRGNSPSGKYRR